MPFRIMGLVDYNNGEIFDIKLNRPEKLNAMNREMLELLVDAFGKADASEESRVVLLSGTGGSFCAGIDLAYLASLKSEEDAGRAFDLFHKLNDGIWKSDKIVVVAINGYCLGGGNELAMACDLRVAEKGAVFGQPEVRHGITPGGGATYRLPYLIGGARARRMMLSGNQIDADEALDIGLIDEVVEKDDAYGAAYKLCEEIAEIPEGAVALTKRAVNSQFVYDTSAERNAFLKSLMSDSARRKIAAFLSKRKV